jgi:hypothetical protein
MQLTYQIADHVETALVELCVECVVGRHVDGDAVRMGPSSKTLLKYLAVHKITDILRLFNLININKGNKGGGVSKL